MSTSMLNATHLLRARSAAQSEQAGAPWRWAAAGLVAGTLAAVAAWAPAQWLADAVQAASQGQVHLLQTQGTVWSGSAQLVFSAGSGSRSASALPGRVQWRIRPVMVGLQLSFAADCCAPQPWVWTVAPRAQGVDIRMSDLGAAQPSVWPGSLLAGLGTPWNTLELQASLALSTQQLRLQWSAGQWQVNGNARLDVNQASTSLSTLKPIGSYRLDFTGGEQPVLQLSTLDGSLQLNGRGAFTAGRLQFDGEATASPDRTEALGNLLNIIGRRDGARSIIKVG